MCPRLRFDWVVAALRLLTTRAGGLGEQLIQSTPVHQFLASTSVTDDNERQHNLIGSAATRTAVVGALAQRRPGANEAPALPVLGEGPGPPRVLLSVVAASVAVSVAVV
jgi:hypothetical protein